LNSDPRLLSWLHVAMVEVVLTRYAESVFNSQAEAVEFVTNQFFSGAGAIRIS